MNLQIELLKEEGMIFNIKCSEEVASNYINYTKPWSMLQLNTELLNIKSGELPFEGMSFYEIIKTDELSYDYKQLLVKLLEQFELSLKVLLNRTYLALEFEQMEIVDNFVFNFPFANKNSYLVNREIVLLEEFLNIVTLEELIFIFNNCIFDYQDVINAPISSDITNLAYNKNIVENNIHLAINVINLTNNMLNANPELVDKSSVFIHNLEYEVDCCIEIIDEISHINEAVVTNFDLLSLALKKLKVVNNDKM